MTLGDTVLLPPDAVVGGVHSDHGDLLESTSASGVDPDRDDALR
jgi:hypothetical protein